MQEYILGIIVLILLFYIFTNKNHTKKYYKQAKGISKDIDRTTHYAIENIPTPLVIVDDKGLIKWSNPSFSNLTQKPQLTNQNIQDLIPEIKLKSITLEKDNIAINVNFNNKTYDVLNKIVNISESKDSKIEYMIVLCFIDRTEYTNIKCNCDEKKVSIGFIHIDNYEELMADTNEIDKSSVLAEIDKKLNSLALKINGFVKKTDRDKYLIVFEKRCFSTLEQDKFEILDEIRDIDQGNNIPVTLSVGIGIGGETLKDTHTYAKAAMDIALGRGGDQAVIKHEDKLSFYGGKSNTLEKRTKVKARVISYALNQIINESEVIFIMGHKIPDMDSFGASIGIYRAIKNKNKKCFIVINNVSSSIKNIYEKLEKEQPDYLADIVSFNQIEDTSYKQSLCIVVDTHIPHQTEAPELLSKAEKVIVIDHHRRGESFIDNPILTYVEPYASSTCELITEILYYIEENIYITKFDAEALLAGIAVDTKNFAFNTGVRTFEAASFLKEKGANTQDVRQLFENDIDTFILRGEIIKNIDIFKEGIVISKLEKETDRSVLVAAQVADEILNIKGIRASFVLANKGDSIHISARSSENISVQLILEKLGGGGHKTVAGVSIEGVDIKEAEDVLKKAIEEYFEEGDR